jgi:pimeloyl-ACP methyl ester carboxylesterase
MLATTAARLDMGVPVTLQCEGMRLVGALHTAHGPAAGVGVILLNQGPIDRTGSHRLYVKLAARLTALGIPTLRFDARGVGESEGEWATERISVLEAYGNIQRGAWVPDTIAAIEFMRRTAKVDRIILGGLCGGAATALFAGAQHPAVEGVFVIGTPVTFSSATQAVADLPDAIIERDVWRYFRKLLQPSAWLRLLSLKTDYSMIANVFGTKLRRVIGRARGADRTTETDASINVPLFDAIKTAAKRRKPLLFVYGENDYLWQEFQEQMPRFGKDRSKLPFALVTIPEANHILTEEPWQDAMYAAVTSWLSPLVAQRATRSA